MKINESLAYFPFLIIGAGPAGLITGIELARQGHRVAIIERNKNQVRPVCGEYLTPEGVNYFKKLRLISTLEGFNQIRGMTLYSFDEEKVSTHFPNDHFGLALNRQILQERLEQKFIQLGGEIFYNSPLERIKKKENLYYCFTPGAIFTSHWAIGADGRQSKLAQLLHFKSTQQRIKKIALHCYLHPKKDLSPFGQMHILKADSYIGINPIHPREANFSLTTTSQDIKDAQGAKELINFWISKRKSLGEQFALIKDEEIKSTSPISRKSVDIISHSAALVGDASGFIGPLTGEGITTAIKTAYFLSEEIKKSHSPSRAFAQYKKRRQKDFAQKEKLHLLFLLIIQRSWACLIVAKILNFSQRLRNSFIAVIGNIYTPQKAFGLLIKSYIKERN